MQLRSQMPIPLHILAQPQDSAILARARSLALTTLLFLAVVRALCTLFLVLVPTHSVMLLLLGLVAILGQGKLSLLHSLLFAFAYISQQVSRLHMPTCPTLPSSWAHFTASHVASEKSETTEETSHPAYALTHTVWLPIKKRIVKQATVKKS
jgi:hypothetical protein